MTRGKMLILAAVLGVGAVLCLVFGINMRHNVRTYVKDHYQSYGANQYTCTGSPSTVADNIARAQPPQARATDSGSYYLRYSDAIVIVGPASSHACTIRLESLSAGYNHGSYFFLGPGFSRGSPSGSSGGSSGGPGGVK
ncbi:hypothetical protein BOO86_13555 [Mycobacterium sp. CBMA 234]|uniref:DUF4247 domain-containing protein n=1 Tax=Mycolicibacterium sp. CBMA 234 TaxID=1918495 RepID=UPI0012DD3636|nr:DUF4247 domain-containing protein [Mycolicibacterium sp. CBMA 234]MUL65499.1 hypothetical protein [Mycolicibacterium sp. CBMA 234]